MADVYRIVTADGQEFAWHKSVAELKKTHPGATIVGRLVPDDIRGGTWEPHTDRQAMAAERKAAEPEKDAEETTTTTRAPAERVVVVVDTSAKKTDK